MTYITLEGYCYIYTILFALNANYICLNLDITISNYDIILDSKTVTKSDNSQLVSMKEILIKLS